MIDPLVSKAAKALQDRGFRITSILRPGSDPSLHSTGSAADVAHWQFHTGYTKRDAEEVARVIRQVVPQQPWLVVAEEDHIHFQPADRHAVGVKNASTNNRLLIEQGDSTMPNLQTLARTKLQAARFARGRFEHGDPNAPAPAATPAGSPLVDSVAMSAPGVNQLVTSLRNMRSDKDMAIIEAASEVPEMLDVARRTKLVRDAVRRQILYVLPDNCKIISSSLGDNALLNAVDLPSVCSTIARGLPPFEPQPFPFTIFDPTTFEFYPLFALSTIFPFGEPVELVGLHIEITAAVLSARPGLVGRLLIEYGPPGSMPQPSMSVQFKLGDGTYPSTLSVIWGAQSGGHAVLATRRGNVTNVPPIPGLNYPRVRIMNLPTGAGIYEINGRFMRTGDYSIDRFSELLNG